MLDYLAIGIVIGSSLTAIGISLAIFCALW
jgi:hypothetical protein